MSRFCRRSAARVWGPASVLVLASGLGALAAKLEPAEEGIFAVETSVENFRDAPNGQKLGTLLKDAEIERISQKGEWVRFRIEGWIWGPSLKGFAAEEEPPEERAAPRLALQDNAPKIKRRVNEKFGVYYGIKLDRDLERLVLRFRIPKIERAALERRQMAAQREVVAILEGKVAFDSVRIETNRPDGGGQVGAEIAETRVGDIHRFGGGAVEEWKAHTRVSTDGGDTWTR